MFNIKKEKSNVEVEMVIDAKEWEESVQKVYESSKGKYNIEGFRKGHAPRKVIEKTYGDSVFFQDTVEFLVNKTINEVLDQNPDMEPVAMPTTQFESFTTEGGLKMLIKFEVIPEFKLCEYKGQTFKVHPSEVTEHDIEHSIHHLLEDNAKFETVDREIKNGDTAVIDFEGFLGDVAFEGGKGEDYPLGIGSHSFIDNFEDQLVGHKKGENVDVKVKFPENYQAEELKGKDATFKVTVKEVREKVLPEFDDKFVSNATEFDTVEAYKKDLTAHIQDMKDKQQQNELEYAIRDYLLKNTNIEIPATMIERECQEDKDRLTQALKAYGISLEDYLKQTGSNLKDYDEMLKERMTTTIKTRYIYRKLLEENKIDLTPTEIKEATIGLSNEQDKIRKENELLLDKLHKFLKENNKVEIIKE